ncbi:MAG: PadR family transcriptional regulator [Coriobacteriia bacterium]|jgi:PadR family transcriptional regulator PadR|nr:PadR family transcriptional regulator [Coriobacteriia bacterium]
MGDTPISSDLIRGHIDTIVLGLLSTEDRYGYDICKQVALLSDNEYELKEPTLYSAARRLEGQGLIRSYWGGESQGGRRKYYAITPDGTQTYQQNLADWKRARRLIDRLVSGEAEKE